MSFVHLEFLQFGQVTPPPGRNLSRGISPHPVSVLHKLVRCAFLLTVFSSPHLASLAPYSYKSKR